MKLTKQKLYKLIMEQVQRMYQVPNSMIKRLQSDPDVPDEHRKKLIMMLQSGDDELIASAEEIMDMYGYGEDYATTDIPVDDMSHELNQAGDNLEIGYRDAGRIYKKRGRDMKIGKYTKTKPHQKFALDAIIKKYFDKFKQRLPSEVMYDKEDRGSVKEQRRLMDLMEDIVSAFFDDTEEAFDDMADNNFFGLAAYEDVLTKNMITYYDNIIYDRNNPIDKRLM